MKMAPEILQELAVAHREITTTNSLSDGNDLFIELVENKFPRLTGENINKILKIVTHEDLFETEYKRAVDEKAIKVAIKKGEKSYISKRPCNTTGCNSNIRYVSNRGCIVCQKTNPEVKIEKQKQAEEALRETRGLEKPLRINKIMSKLGVKKSTAYLLISKEQNNQTHYQTNHVFNK